MSNYIIDATRSNFEDAVLRNLHRGPVMVNDLVKRDPDVTSTDRNQLINNHINSNTTGRLEQ